MFSKNGGFPPIIYCNYDKETKQPIKKESKQREYAPDKTKINMKELLKQTTKQDLFIDLNENVNDDLTILN